MRENLYQTHIRKFHSIMNDYNTAAHGFKQDLQGQIGTQTDTQRTHRRDGGGGLQPLSKDLRDCVCFARQTRPLIAFRFLYCLSAVSASVLACAATLLPSISPPRCSMAFLVWRRIIACSLVLLVPSSVLRCVICCSHSRCDCSCLIPSLALSARDPVR